MQTNSLTNLTHILEHLITIPLDSTGTQLMIKIDNITKKLQTNFETFEED